MQVAAARFQQILKNKIKGAKIKMFSPSSPFFCPKL
jgi:hypothetical protein